MHLRKLFTSAALAFALTGNATPQEAVGEPGASRPGIPENHDDLGEKDASCCAETEPVVLDPLPADATEKERALRRYHDLAHENAENVFLSTKFIEDMRTRLAAQSKDASFSERFAVRFTLLLWLQRTGDLDQAIRFGEECLAMLREHPGEGPGWRPETMFRLAAANFRIAEKRNCIARHTSESCIFPLAGSAIHVDKRGADAARVILERLLETPDSDLRFEAQWLLNIAHMAIGDWPSGVPEKYRIAAETFAPEATLPRFVDRGRELGLAHHNHAGSVILDDFTGDGRLDVFTVAFDTGKSAQLIASDGEGGFLPISRAAGLDRQLGGINAIQGDVDGDGRLDVLVLRGGGFFSGDRVPDSLLRQDAPGRFVDVTAAAGIEIAAPGRCAAFADVDLDGDLDLFVGYETRRTESGFEFPSKLFANDGHGAFTDATAASGIMNPEKCVGASFGDIDADGDPDLYVSNWLARNRLFVNSHERGATKGGIAFTERAEERGVAVPESSGPVAFFDSDGDGDLDLFVSFNHHDRPIRAVARFHLEGVVEGESQALYENDGTGRFRDVTVERGLRRVIFTTGLNVGDVDDDGFQDLYLASGAHDLAALFPNVLLLGGEKFRDATFAAGVGHLQKGNGIAFGDIDGDLDLDIFLQVGGFYQDDAFGNVLFENPGNANHKLEVDLVGTRDNRFGVGARVRARLTTPGGPRDVYAFVGPGGSLGSNPLRAHLGLGDATAIEFVEVNWPAAGTTQRVDGVKLDTRIRVEQR